MSLRLLCVALAILSITEAAVDRQYGRQRSTGHYSPQKSVPDRRINPVSRPNPFLRQRVYRPRTQNSPPNWPQNRHLVQSPSVHAFSRRRMNLQRPQYFPPAQPYNHQWVQPHLPQTYQNKRNQNHHKLNYQQVPQGQPNPPIKHLPTTLQPATRRRVPPSTRNNKHSLVNLNANSRNLGPSTTERVGKQLVLPRIFLQGSQNTQQSSTIGSQQTGQDNRTNHTCSNGKIWRNGECVCPYLANWDAVQGQCVCIYGTYRHSSGDCRSF